MTISQLAALVGILSAVLAVASIIYSYLRAAAVKVRIEAQDGTIAVQVVKIKQLEDDLNGAKERVASLERENESLRTVVTAKHEIELVQHAVELVQQAVQRLQQAEDSHHAETIAELRAIREALTR